MSVLYLTAPRLRDINLESVLLGLSLREGGVTLTVVLRGGGGGGVGRRERVFISWRGIDLPFRSIPSRISFSEGSTINKND